METGFRFSYYGAFAQQAFDGFPDLVWGRSRAGILDTGRRWSSDPNGAPSIYKFSSRC